MNAVADSRPLTGACAMVTGAGTGIGRAITLALAARGLHVVALGRRAAPLADLADAASGLPGRVRPATADVSLPGVLDDVAARHLAPDARLEVIVASAGAFTRGPVASLTTDAWDAQIASNLTAAFHTLALASRRMTAQELVDGRRGHVFTPSTPARA
ncbi:SDR family oxidoreductase [Nocardioides yefusunii]|uniref:SDR family oxidoreductase n=1 Tax=Nocardioides yefusunii TaxID=2500546 RepID=A0ABW1QS89_9ACTN|nr:SDR family NAD(P)-dependent oxidoreductase [Nocardioides yefusunii]